MGCVIAIGRRKKYSNVVAGCKFESKITFWINGKSIDLLLNLEFKRNINKCPPLLGFEPRIAAVRVFKADDKTIVPP